MGYGWRRNDGDGDVIRGQNSGYGIGVAEGQTRPRSQGEVGRPAEEEVRVSGNVATSSRDRRGVAVSALRACAPATCCS